MKSGGVGSAILEFIAKHNYKNSVTILGINDSFIEHGTIDELQKINGIDTNSIKNILLNLKKVF